MLFYIVLGLIAGACYASQGAVNGRLAHFTGHVVTASVISFIVGLTLLLLATAAVRPPLPTLAGLRTAPWWSFLGGAFGAFVVFSAALSVPRLGIGLWVGIFLAGILTTSMLLDHVGAFGLPERPISGGKLAGAALLGVGAWLIQHD